MPAIRYKYVVHEANNICCYFH